MDFVCVHCETKQSLTSKGVYNRVRLVLDSKDYYYLAGEYMGCKTCKGTFISWDHRMLEQLSDGVRARFPVVLTHKYACDKAIVSLLRARTLGNSPSALRQNMKEVHSEEWLRMHLCYLSDCEQHRKRRQELNLPIPQYEEATPCPPFPSTKWFLSIHVRDVWSRLPALLAEATSIYGNILKIDSTKKICKKLQGAAANTATWTTNIGNERGEVLQSVLTSSEGIVDLQRLAEGLMDRYEKAGQDPPALLYTDRDCCSQGQSKLQQLFGRWSDLQVRLDIWHFMRRLAVGCSSESHPLYGTFMAHLSSSIFEWDAGDFDLLMVAKRGEMVRAGIPNPPESAIKKAISKEELARHCRRRTRGVGKTVELIESLLLALSSATDTLGVPLLKEEMQTIWDEQRKHIACIQDPPNMSLYTITGHSNKGGVQLPILRCARGTTSLESFHLHLARFIPGTSASDLHFQAYLLEGLTRWNAARASSALHPPTEPTLRTFDTRLQSKVKALSQSVHGKDILTLYQPPAQYTGELFGVEYLYDQCGKAFSPTAEELDQQIDEGFEDIGEDSEPLAPLEVDDGDPTVASPVDEGDSSEEGDEVGLQTYSSYGWGRCHWCSILG